MFEGTQHWLRCLIIMVCLKNQGNFSFNRRIQPGKAVLPTRVLMALSVGIQIQHSLRVFGELNKKNKHSSRALQSQLSPSPPGSWVGRLFYGLSWGKLFPLSEPLSEMPQGCLLFEQGFEMLPLIHGLLGQPWGTWPHLKSPCHGWLLPKALS